MNRISPFWHITFSGTLHNHHRKMILSYSPYPSSSSRVTSSLVSSNTIPHVKLTLPTDHPPSQAEPRTVNRSPDVSLAHHGSSCSCGRRRLFFGATATSLLPSLPSKASNYKDILQKVHPERPDWYEEFYASVMNTSMKSYESEIASYKSELFANLEGKARKVLEIGIGTGPNLRYYVGDTDVQVLGIDPNKKMEKYAKAAAVAAGLPLPNFEFIQAVGEGLPLSDDSVDAIVGTLVLCSVKDVNMALKEVKRVLKPGGLYLFIEHVAAKEGTALRFIQKALDPLQQTLADGCHLTRETGKLISETGFSDLKISSAFLSNASLINPHVYGIASK